MITQLTRYYWTIDIVESRLELLTVDVISDKPLTNLQYKISKKKTTHRYT